MATVKTKGDRLDCIREAIACNAISSQDELLRIVKKRGFDITQATLSRDLKELKVAKVSTAGGYRYRIDHREAANHKGSSGIIGFDAAGSLAVIKTVPGFASAVAITIDGNVRSRAVMGTIAGDDTVLVILRGSECLGEAVDAISEFIPSIKKLSAKY